MGIEDIADLAAGHSDQVNQVVDQAAEKVKEMTPDQADGLVDQAADAAKGALDNQ